MNYRKNIITYFIMSVVLIIIAVCIRVFVTEKVSDFIVSILIGAATGIVATMVACIFDNNQKLQDEVLLFERTACHILGEIYKIANLDAKQDITVKVNNNVMAIYDYFSELQEVAKKIDRLFVMRKREEELKVIYKQLEKVHTFILFDFKPLNNVKEVEPDKYEEIALFEALKVIKFAREFNPQPILKIIQKSKNNKPKTINGREEFYNIIFERDVFNNKRKKEGKKFMKKEIKLLCDLYSKYDINKVISAVDKVQIGDWTFSTKISGKEERKIKKLWDEIPKGE